jgi:hypothetical protein
LEGGIAAEALFKSAADALNGSPSKSDAGAGVVWAKVPVNIERKRRHRRVSDLDAGRVRNMENIFLASEMLQ